ncbi:FAD-dependent thymidylate synthase [Methylobacterium oryzae CBMB20]
MIDYMGDDSAVVQAARVSYGRGTKRTSEDKGLIDYLIRHWHTTPFEMAELKLHVKLPIFVARQWIRHRTASVNEYSARYSVLDNEFYVPTAENLAAQSTSNRQGRGETLPARDSEQVLELIKSESNRAYHNYTWMLNENAAGEAEDPSRIGVARELARMNLTLNTYTQWYWKVNLHNLLQFLRLRADPHAQYEIRVYAEHILRLVQLWVPLTYEAFVEHRLKAAHLSRSALEVISLALEGKDFEDAKKQMGSREWNELVTRFPALRRP